MLEDTEGTKAVEFSHRDFRFVAEALKDAARKLGAVPRINAGLASPFTISSPVWPPAPANGNTDPY